MSRGTLQRGQVASCTGRPGSKSKNKKKEIMAFSKIFFSISIIFFISFKVMPERLPISQRTTLKRYSVNYEVLLRQSRLSQLILTITVSPMLLSPTLICVLKKLPNLPVPKWYYSHPLLSINIGMVGKSTQLNPRVGSNRIM